MVRLKGPALLIGACALSAQAAPKTTSPATITSAPDPSLAIKVATCIKYTEISTDKLSLSCRTLSESGSAVNKRQHIIPHTCEWVGGITTKCIAGGRALGDDMPPATPTTFTATDTVTVSSSGAAPSTTTTIVTGTARISAIAPTAAGASWWFSLSEDLMSDIYEISAGVCSGIAKRRILEKRKGGEGAEMGLACPLTDLSEADNLIFQEELIDLIEGEEVWMQNLRYLEAQLVDAAGNVPHEMLDNPPTDPALAQAWAEEAVESMALLAQEAGLNHAVLDSLLKALAIGGGAGTIYALHELSDSDVVKALHDVKKLGVDMPLPQTSPGGEATASVVSKTNNCAMCTSGACSLSPDDDQGQDGSAPPLAPATPTPTPTKSFICSHGASPEQSQQWCNCPDGNRYSTSPSAFPYTFTSPKTSTGATIEYCPYTAIPGPGLSYSQPTTAPPEITAPLTQGYSSPTTAIPISTASCAPDGVHGSVAVWKQPFLQDRANWFCSWLVDNPQTANASNPFWLYRTYPSSGDSIPANEKVSFYIHYEKQACSSQNIGDQVQLGGEGALDCYAHFNWLWTTGCDTILKANAGDVGLDRYFPSMGYYSDCMWWGIVDDGAQPPCETSVSCTTYTGYAAAVATYMSCPTTSCSTAWSMVPSGCVQPTAPLTDSACLPNDPKATSS